MVFVSLNAFCEATIINASACKLQSTSAGRDIVCSSKQKPDKRQGWTHRAPICQAVNCFQLLASLPSVGEFVESQFGLLVFKLFWSERLSSSHDHQSNRRSSTIEPGACGQQLMWLDLERQGLTSHSKWQQTVRRWSLHRPSLSKGQSSLAERWRYLYSRRCLKWLVGYGRWWVPLWPRPCTIRWTSYPPGKYPAHPRSRRSRQICRWLGTGRSNLSATYISAQLSDKQWKECKGRA